LAYSESLALRVRNLLGRRRGIAEKKMFGGVVFLLHGNMLVGVWKNSLIARLGPDQAEAALQRPNVVEFDVTGRPMRGWVMIEPEGLDTDEQLQEWIAQATEFVETLERK
jgi:hypothetical protein